MAFKYLTPTKVAVAAPKTALAAAVQKKVQQTPVPVEHPFAASPLGIAVNTVLGLFNPKTYVKVAQGTAHLGKEIGQGVARSIGSAGLALTEPITHEETLNLEDIKNPTVRKVFGKIFGQEPIDSLAKRIADNEIKIKDSPFAQKIGLAQKTFKIGGKEIPAPLAVAFGAVLGDAALNLTPFGGGETALVDQLAKEGTEEGVIKILTKANVVEDVAKQFAKHFAETKTPAEAEAVLKIMKGAIGTKQIAEHGAAVAAEELASKAAKPAENIAKQLPEGFVKKEVPSLIKGAEEAPKVAETITKNIVPKGAAQVAEEAPKITKALEPAIKSPLGNTINQQQQVVLDKVTNAIREAAPIRAETEKLYSAERGRRLAQAEAASAGKSGPEFFQAQKSALGGALPKAQYETVLNKVTQQDVETMFNMIRDHPLLNQFEKINTAEGLGKLLGQGHYGGAVPQEKELELLRQVFPESFIKTVLDKRSTGEKALKIALEAVNVPKALRASFDLSAPFRQGLFLATRNPKQFVKAFVPMIRSFMSEEAYQAVKAEIASRPTYQLMKDAKLALTDIAQGLSKREEQFLSPLAEKLNIPTGPAGARFAKGIGPGRIVRASERGYITFLNKLRADVFDKMVQGAESIGRDPKADNKLLGDIGNFINTFSGRGDLSFTGHGGKAEYGGALQFLNGIFFSPRLALSRLHILNPVYYAKMDPFVRKEALKSLFTTVGAGLTVLGLAGMNKGVEVGMNPTSADFGKIKVGNTRFDIWGGAQQYIRMIAQIATGKYTSTTTGKTIGLNDPEAYKGLTKLDILGRQIQSKEAPIASFVTDWLRGKDYIGEPFKLSTEARNLVVPLFIQDLIEVSKNDPTLLPPALLAGLGVGVQSYGPTSTSKKPKAFQTGGSTSGKPKAFQKGGGTNKKPKAFQ